MAGIGSAWGSREEMLHPRDRHGRFRKKWKMAASVVDALSSFLDRFQPRQFQSDQQASQYSFNNRKTPWSTPELQRLHTDWDDANESLQAGEMDDTTKKFVAMMDRNMVETTDDLIVSQTVPTTAFGLSPQQAAMEDGGLEDLIGLEIADAGYSASNLGTELSHPPGSVTLRVAVPKGTRVAYGGRSPSDRSVIFDRDQPLVVTKVESDGRGGYYMLAIAGSGARTKGVAAVADDRTHGRRGGGLTPEQREARVSPRMSDATRGQIAQQEQQQNEAATLAHQRQVQGQPSPPSETPVPAPTQTPAPAAPTASPQTPPPAGVPERREPVLKDSVGPGSPEGKSASDIATDAEAARVQAENAPPAPAAPPSPADFRAATADIPSPAAGKRRVQWTKAHQGVVTGKRDSADVLRELDTDIAVARGSQARIARGEDPADPNLDSDLDSMEKLADAISEHSGVPRRGREAKGTGDGTSPTPTPAAPKSAGKAGPTPTPGAPSTKKESTPKAPGAAPDRRTKAQLLEEAGDAGRPRMTKEQLRQAIAGKQAKAEAPAAPAPAKKAPGSKFTPDQEQALVDRAKKFRGKEANDEERRIVGEADKILGRGEGKAPAKKVAAKKAVPEAPAAPAKKVAGPDRAGEMSSLRSFAERERAKKAAPAKAAPSPEDAAEEAFKARVAEAGLPDRVTALRAMAKDQKIRGFSTMNKKQLQQVLLGDEVNTSNKIGVVPPARMVPHLEAAESDQAARALLEKHTLTDLKALAKHREIKLPSRGATKGKVTDMVLEDIRGPQEGITGRTPDTSLNEDLDQLGYIDLPGANGDRIKQEISQVDGDDPESLRTGRDNLEKASKQLRGDGDKDAANMAQAAADAMGMRAQTISGVEEGAPPVKRVAKKAVPEVDADAPEVERPLEKMLKPELLALATKEGASGVRPSWSKAKILDEIKRNRRMDSSRGGETDEERIRRELGTLPGGAERFQGPTAGPLRLPDRAPTAEEIQRDNPDLDVQKLFNDAGIPTNDPGGLVSDTKLTLKQEGPKVAAKRLRTEADRMIDRIPEARAQSQRKTMPTPADADKAEADVRANADKVRQVADKIEAAPPAKKVTKKAAKKAVADVDKAAGNLAAEVRSTPSGTGESFGDTLRRTDAEELRQAVKESGLGDIEGNTAEEIFDNTIKEMLESRMRELGMLPDDPKKPTRAKKRVPKGSVSGPKADQPIATPGRRESFTEAWDSQGFADDPSLAEVREDIASGKISQEEGVRRLDSEITFHEEEMSDLASELEGMAPEDRDEESGVADGIHARRAELSDAITNNKKAIKFLRGHAQNEAPVTREELEIKLDGPEKAALDRVELDELKQAARNEGLGDIQGDDKDTVIQNIGKAIAGKELANREKEQRARDRQARIDEVRSVSDNLSQLEQMAQNGGSDKALATAIRRLPKADQAKFTGDKEHFWEELDDVLRGHGLSRVGEHGATIPYDPQKHEGVDLPQGAPVYVSRVGHSLDLGSGDKVIFKAHVLPSEPRSPEAPAAPVKKALPEAAPGTAAGKITSSRLAPGHRVMMIRKDDGTWGIATRKTGAVPVTVERAERVSTGTGRSRLHVDGRDPDGNEVQFPSMAPSQTVTLEPALKAPKATKAAVPTPEAPAAPAPKKAAKFLPPLKDGTQRKSFTNVEVGDVVKRAGSKGEAKRVTKVDRGPGGVDLTFEDGTTVNGNPNTAAWMGGGAPETPAAPKVTKKAAQAVPDIVPEAPAAPVKKVAKAAVPAKATPKPVVDLDNPTKHDAEVVGTGLDLDAKGEDKQWLAVVQKDLDAGIDGRQIADGLRRGADSERTLHNIEAEAGGATPDTGRAARINRMELMADRLEGVRPIPKPEAPKKAAADVVRGFDTHLAAQAASRARADLRSGKSHTEVATSLRTAATQVGSRDHDVTPMSRVGDPTPSEKSFMKRGDARMLRELAAEIQAEGVAQRAEARAAKKATTPAKAPSARGSAIAQAREERKREGNGAPVTPAPKKRTAAEMKRARNASESEGVPVEQILERWDGQKQDRKNLTGPVGEMVAAQIEDANQALLAADTPARESEATGRLLHPELRTWATKLGLSPSGTKAVLEKRIADRVKGREAPTTSAERAVPKAPGGMTDQPPKPHSWGTFGQRGDQHYFHPDGQIPMTMKRLGPEGQLDVGGGESLHNAMGDIASDMVMGRISGDAGVARLRALATKLPAGSEARRKVAALADELDQPAVAMPRLPDDTPAPVRRLLQQVMTFPIARATGHFGSSTYEKSLVDKIADFVREKASGESSIVGMNDGLARLITNHTHESQEGSMGLRALTQPLFKDDSEISQALLAWAKEIGARRRST